MVEDKDIPRSAINLPHGRPERQGWRTDMVMNSKIIWEGKNPYLGVWCTDWISLFQESCFLAKTPAACSSPELSGGVPHRNGQNPRKEKAKVFMEKEHCVSSHRRG